MLLRIIKHFFFHQSNEDAEVISKIAFHLDKLENLLGDTSYFDESVGDTANCLTGSQIVELVFLNKDHPHLKECAQCRECFKELQSYSTPETTDIETFDFRKKNKINAVGWTIPASTK